jgi:DNA-binding transcriptional LysR family regulator
LFGRPDTARVSLLHMDLRLLRYFVAVAEERHFGRAAARLHMTQPPLSRAIKELEADLGTILLLRSSTGVTLTAAGALLYDEARTLLEQADHVRARVAAAGGATITIGTLADSVADAGNWLLDAFRREHPEVQVRVREADFTDPTAGLRSGLADVAITREPFDRTGISTYVLRTDSAGVVLRADDPLAERDIVHLSDLEGRQWLRLPEGTDPAWRSYWNGAVPGDELHDGPVVRTVSECMQAVLWNGSVGVAPLTHALPEGLVSVPLADMRPSRLVLAWNSATTDPLILSLPRIAAAEYRPAAAASS